MRIIIAGGGFAGINAAKELSKSISMEHEIILINKYDYTTMLPNLPEITSGRLEARDISEKTEKLLPKRVKFVVDEIKEINFKEKSITTKENIYNYDYLIQAVGSTTNFYGFSQNIDKINILESLETAKTTKRSFESYMQGRSEGTLVVSGAGFTGIELACNLYAYCKKQDKKLRVIFIERSSKILRMLSEKSANHVIEKFNKMGFEIFTESQVVDFNGKDIVLKSGKELKDVFFAWCSGVKSCVKPIGDYQALPDDRIVVNEFLQVPEYTEVYAVGDSAAIKDKEGNFLRRAVNFAQMSGKAAGKNLALKLSGKSQIPFNPIDLGWIIPIYISSIGVVIGRELKGRKGIFMHFIICGMKNFNVRNFLKEMLAGFKFTFTKL